MRPILATGALFAIFMLVLGSFRSQAADNPSVRTGSEAGAAAQSSATPRAQGKARQAAAGTGRAAMAPATKKRGVAASAKEHNQPPAAQGQPVKLNEVVVTATRLRQPLSQIGTSVSVMTGEQMQNQKLGVVAPAMQQLPGVEVNQAGSPGTVTDVTIRGSTAAQTLVLIDGVDVNTASTGGFDFSIIPTDNVQQVEVVRGSGGAL